MLDRVSDEAFAAKAVEEFRAADVDFSGSLSADELLPVVESLLKDLAPAGSFNITHEHCVQFANIFDDDHNGTISLNEFFGFVQTITLIGYLQSQEQEQAQAKKEAQRTGKTSGGGDGSGGLDGEVSGLHGGMADIAAAAMADRKPTENRADSESEVSESESESESESDSDTKSGSEDEGEGDDEGGRRRTRSHAESHGSGHSNDAASYYGLDADAINAAAAAAAGLA